MAETSSHNQSKNYTNRGQESPSLFRILTKEDSGLSTQTKSRISGVKLEATKSAAAFADLGT
ncbi:hypothetical protein C1H46_027371 [Malus baccata]|uniref:Uncharacterized protein n=1 Tax=Malus baccata TaxID=106549 RepID=A0A540LKT8_MALBA|nr:hypothetical protein C1H46_027371 [Malus baccata]